MPKEINSSDIMHIGFLKKECFNGSSEGMRYRLEGIEGAEGLKVLKELKGVEEPKGFEKPKEFEKPKGFEGADGLEGVGEPDGKGTGQNEKLLLVTAWPEPFSFDKTKKELRESKAFPFTEEGLDLALSWLNCRKEKGWGQ